MNETIKNLVKRRSVRNYMDKQIEHSDLELILEAGTYAPSAMGRQAAIMVVVQDRDIIERMEKINAAVMNKPEDKPFYGAPTVIVVFADTRLTNNGIQDGSLVMGNIMNAAFSLGIDSCWINRATESFFTDEGKELMEKWGLDSNYLAVANCILGYKTDDLPQPKPRRDGLIIRG